MKKWEVQMVSGFLMLALACCSQMFEGAGTRTLLAVDVEFVGTDEAPVANAPVYVVETIGTMHPVTEVLKTDTHGYVLLKGYYCLPTVVATHGGTVVIQHETLASSYRVMVKGGTQPSLDQLAGKPESEFLGYSRKHIDCG
jgi:hypothetical protein